MSLSRTPTVFISVVSHEQASLVEGLLADIDRWCEPRTVAVHVTLNTSEATQFSPRDFSYELSLAVNPEPRGYGANQNAAFRRSTAEFYCAINPDVRLSENPFPQLIDDLRRDGMGAVAPLVVDSDGEIQDNARRFPTLPGLVRRLVLGPITEYPIHRDPFSVDWIAGMFMLFPKEAFARVRGFDERYWLYYEDADLCARLQLAGYRIVVDPRVTVLHDAQRRSRRSVRHAYWHVTSALRFLASRRSSRPEGARPQTR